jgi:tripartite-type tricarboxylate transporter receptor subunit TctC
VAADKTAVGVARVLLLLLLAISRPLVAAEPYPARPIKIVVGLPPGSGVDMVTRIVADKLRDALGQPVVVENRSGADGIIAARYVSSSAADGYTLFAASSGQMSVIPVMYTPAPFDPARDFAPISLVAQWSLALVVTPDVPASSVQELVAYAKAHPGKLNYGSASSNYMLATEMFTRLTGTQLRQIPYTAVPGVMNALLAGDVQVAVINTLTLAPYVKSGKLKALAIAGASRDPALPDVPTLREAGVPGYSYVMWMGMLAPAGTPPEVLAKLQATVAQIIETADVRERLAGAGVVPLGSSSQTLRETIERDSQTYSTLAKSLRTDDK